MEILLFILVISIFVITLFLKSKLSVKYRLNLAVFGGALLIIWFWTNPDVVIYLKVIVTVVVVENNRRLFIEWKKLKTTTDTQQGQSEIK